MPATPAAASPNTSTLKKRPAKPKPKQKVAKPHQISLKQCLDALEALIRQTLPSATSTALSPVSPPTSAAQNAAPPLPPPTPYAATSTAPLPVSPPPTPPLKPANPAKLAVPKPNPSKPTKPLHLAKAPPPPTCEDEATSLAREIASESKSKKQSKILPQIPLKNSKDPEQVVRIVNWRPLRQRHLDKHLSCADSSLCGFDAYSLDDDDPRLEDQASAGDAYTWEGGRGFRCDFWRSVGELVPE